MCQLWISEGRPGGLENRAGEDVKPAALPYTTEKEEGRVSFFSVHTQNMSKVGVLRGNAFGIIKLMFKYIIDLQFLILF